MRSFVLGLVLALAAATGWTADHLPGGGKPVFSGDAWSAFELVGNDKDKGAAEKVAVTGQPFTSAWHLTTKAAVGKSWNLQFIAPCPISVGVGDVLYAEFYLRSVSGGAETAEGHSGFVFEQSGDPWTKSAEVDVVAGRDWKKFQIPFEVHLSTGEKGSHICFRLGFDPQTIEIGGFQLLDYGTKVKISDLPKTKATYQGREPDAPWRKAALDRIEKIRKSDLRISVVDASGRPVPDAKVKLKMLKQRFVWGTAAQAQRLAGENPDDVQYKEEIPKWFNQIVFENDLKWPFWENGKEAQGGFNNQWVEDSFKFLKANGMTIRGHNLVWPSWRNLPGRLRDLQNDKVALAEAVHKHILEEAGLYKGRLADWDVINEPYAEHDLLDLLGRDVMVDWFKWAHEADPTAKLYLNEYGIFSGGGLDRDHQEDFFKNLTFLKEKGAPIDGLGIQSHLGSTLTPPERLLALLDRFGSLGLSIKITELDFDDPEPGLAYDYMRDYLIVLFSHPAVVGMMMWGFWDGAHWHGEAPLFTKDWELKPAGKAFKDLVRGTWWTDGEGKTDAAGVFVFRGIQGDYQLQVNGKGGKSERLVSIQPGDHPCPVTLK
jgi:GH35 family endo-1,4-beta-xylanase